MQRITTASGAVYLVYIDNLEDQLLIQRVNEEHVKRGDGEWQRLISRPQFEIGHRAVLIMDTLIRYGLDDQGTPADDAEDTTTRITTPVVSIEEVDE